MLSPEWVHAGLNFDVGKYFNGIRFGMFSLLEGAVDDGFDGGRADIAA